MDELVPNEEYAMAAVIGGDNSLIEKICSDLEKEGKFVVPANYNCSSQTVISGNLNAVDEAIDKLKAEGIRKVIKLKTSGPFHTKKLIEAKNAIEKELEKVEFKEPTSLVIKNIDGKTYSKDDDIKDVLKNHIVSPVRFDKAIKLLEEKGIEEYIEIGPRKNIIRFY